MSRWLTEQEVLAAHHQFGRLNRKMVRIAMGPNWPLDWEYVGIFDDEHDNELIGKPSVGAQVEGVATVNSGAREPALIARIEALEADVAASEHNFRTMRQLRNDAADRIEALEAALRRCQTVLGNMALENEGAIFNRWPINHEPLRNDARNLLPVIDAALDKDDGK